MDMRETDTSQLKYVHCSNFSHNEATINKQSTDEDNYQSLTPPQSHNRKRRLSYDSDVEVAAPRNEKSINTCHQIAIPIPIMAKRLRHNITNYSRWRRNGFDVVLVFNKHEERAVTNILQHTEYASDMKISFVMHSYTTGIPSNSGIAKRKAYCILKKYLQWPDFQFALLLDNTVNDIINIWVACLWRYSGTQETSRSLRAYARRDHNS